MTYYERYHIFCNNKRTHFDLLGIVLQLTNAIKRENKSRSVANAHNAT